MVAGNNSFLTKPQFYTTLRLISLAQARVCTDSCLLLGPNQVCRHCTHKDESCLRCDAAAASMQVLTVWLAAQRSGGTLPEATARSLLIGVGAPVPPPRLTGLEVPESQSHRWQDSLPVRTAV